MRNPYFIKISSTRKIWHTWDSNSRRVTCLLVNPAEIKELDVWRFLIDTVDCNVRDLVLVDVTFPINMISANSVNVERRLENWKIGPKFDVPDNSNGLVNIVVVESILELSLFENGLVGPPEECPQALVGWQSLESFSCRVSDLNLVDIYAEVRCLLKQDGVVLVKSINDLAKINLKVFRVHLKFLLPFILVIIMRVRNQFSIRIKIIINIHNVFQWDPFFCSVIAVSEDGRSRIHHRGHSELLVTVNIVEPLGSGLVRNITDLKLILVHEIHGVKLWNYVGDPFLLSSNRQHCVEI